MNYSKIIKNDFCAAPGVCVTLFVSGCAKQCPGCHNPELWDPEAGTPFTEETIEEIIQALGANGIQRNLCLMGGDPFYKNNPTGGLIELIYEARNRYPNLKVYTWTGYTYEELIKMPQGGPAALLRDTDYLIDGPFIQELRDITLPMRGSSNQRILHLQDGKIIN